MTPVTSDRDAARGAAVDYLQQVRREDRLADKVVGMLKQAILGGRLKPGDRLPPERILGERFGVSRTVVREAIRSLAAMGLVDVRSGSGSVVARVDATSVTETVQLFVRASGIDRDAVDEVRAMLLVHLAGVAAERATDDDLGALREAQHRAAPDADFLRGIARAARNPLYPVLLDALGEASRRSVGPGRERILQRIAAHDPRGARQEMRLHLAEEQELPG